jgi:hypothetical protein
MASEARRPWLGYALLAAWALAGVIGMGSLAVSHTVALPAPTEEAKLAAAALDLRPAPGKPFLLHVIFGGCSCTRRLFAHLLKRGPLPGTQEAILFVGEDAEKRKAAEARGFRFTTTTAEALAARFGLEEAPVLLVFDPQGTLRYVGGYFDNPAAVTARDERVYGQVGKGEVAAPLPVYGCAVSRKLQKAVDPLGIVY